MTSQSMGKELKLFFGHPNKSHFISLTLGMEAVNNLKTCVKSLMKCTTILFGIRPNSSVLNHYECLDFVFLIFNHLLFRSKLSVEKAPNLNVEWLNGECRQEEVDSKQKRRKRVEDNDENLI